MAQRVLQSDPPWCGGEPLTRGATGASDATVDPTGQAAGSADERAGSGSSKADAKGDRRRVALVTGGAIRLGRAIALALADAGLDVAITYRSSEDEAQETVSDIRARGVRSECFRVDLDDLQKLPEKVKGIGETMGALDVVVASASVFDRTPFDKVGPADWDRQMDTNAKSQFFLLQAAAPWLREGIDGCIVTMLDTSTKRPWSGYLPYTASKAALESITIGLARALAPKVRVNAVAPGPVLPPPDYDEDNLRRAADATLLKRWGGPEDIAAAVRFLVAETDYVTGVVLRVDGGRAVSG